MEDKLDYRNIENNQNALLLHIKDDNYCICENLETISEEIKSKKAFSAKIIKNIPMDYTKTMDGYTYHYIQFDTDLSGNPLKDPNDAKCVLLIHDEKDKELHYDLKGEPCYKGYTIVSDRHEFGREVFLASLHINSMCNTILLADDDPVFCRDLFHTMYSNKDKGVYKMAVINNNNLYVTQKVDDLEIEYRVIKSAAPVIKRSKCITTDRYGEYSAIVSFTANTEDKDGLYYELSLDKIPDCRGLSLYINNPGEYTDLVGYLRALCYDYLDEGRI